MVEVIGYKEGLPVVVNPGFSPENCHRYFPEALDPLR